MSRYQVETEDGVYEIETSAFNDYKEPERVAVKLNDEIRQMILDEIRTALRDRIAQIVSEVKPERVIETKIIEREGPKTEKVVIREIDQKALEKAISERLAAYSKQTEERWKNIAPIVVPSPIANMEGQGGKFLSTDGRISIWKTVTSGGGGSSPDVYTPNNVTTTRTYDATLTSLDEIANVLGSLIQSLQGAGIIQ